MTTCGAHGVVMTTDAHGPGHARFALVTGSNKGIGKAISAGLAARGFTVYLAAPDAARRPAGAGDRAAPRAAARGTAAAADLAAIGDVRPIPLDVTSDNDVAGAVHQVGIEAGRLDV